VGSVPRWVLVVVGVVVLVAALDVLVFVAARGHGEAAVVPQARGGAVAVIDPRSGRVMTHISVGREPTVVAAGFGGVWVLNKAEGTVTHIDARRSRVVATLQPDATANTLTLGAGGVWFAGHARGNTSLRLESALLERIDPATGRIDRRFNTRTGATILAAGRGAIWSTGYLGGHIRGAARSDAATGTLRRLDIGIYGDLVTADDDTVFYVASTANRVASVSTRTGLLTGSLNLISDASLAAGHIPASPTGAALGGGSVWISKSDGTVLRLPRDLSRITADIKACTNALAIAYGESAVWLACSDGTVARVDPATNRAAKVASLGRLPRGIAAGEGGVWVTLN
jgi:DNA-binding beta-propeller fold protein YncE